MNDKQRAIQQLRRFIQSEFNNRQRFLKEPRRTQAMREATVAMQALDKLAAEVGQPAAAQMSFTELLSQK